MEKKESDDRNGRRKPWKRPGRWKPRSCLSSNINFLGSRTDLDSLCWIRMHRDAKDSRPGLLNKK